MHRLVPIRKRTDVPADFRDTPVADLLMYHNAGQPHKSCDTAELLIGMCMDNRKSLNIPENFAFIIRAGGANLRYSEFKVSYAIAVGEVEYVALIGHTQCGMVDLAARKRQFIEGLCQRAGWTPEAAEDHFNHYAPLFEIGNAVDFVLTESERFSQRYPRIKTAPLLYKVEDHLIYWINRHETGAG